MQQFLLACEADSRGRAGLENQDYPQRELLIRAFDAANKLDIQALLADRDTSDDKPGSVKEFIHQKRMQAIRQALGKES